MKCYITINITLFCTIRQIASAQIYTLLWDVFNSTNNILPLSGLATLTGQRTLTVFEESVSGKLEQFISNTFLCIKKPAAHYSTGLFLQANHCLFAKFFLYGIHKIKLFPTKKLN